MRNTTKIIQYNVIEKVRTGAMLNSATSLGRPWILYRTEDSIGWKEKQYFNYREILQTLNHKS